MWDWKESFFSLSLSFLCFRNGQLWSSTAWRNIVKELWACLFSFLETFRFSFEFLFDCKTHESADNWNCKLVQSRSNAAFAFRKGWNYYSAIVNVAVVLKSSVGVYRWFLSDLRASELLSFTHETKRLRIIEQHAWPYSWEKGNRQKSRKNTLQADLDATWNVH